MCRPAFLLPLIALAALGLAAAPGIAMPLHPRVAEALARSGALPAFAREQAELARQGLDRPPRAARVRRVAGKRVAGMQVAVILVDFSDNPWQSEPGLTPAHFRDLLFSRGTHATGSMRDYYLENSYGQFDLTGQVSGWHRMAQTYAYYVNGRRGTRGPYPRNAQKLVEDAVRLAEAQDPALDWRQFDNDGPDGIPSSGDDDGAVDGLVVVHAGPGFEETGNPNHIHSHYWNVVDLDLTVDGVRVFNYMITPQNGRIGVFAHEFGHNLGLVDLYETDGGPSSVVGVWSVMSLGAWLSATGGAFGPGSGTRPSHFDAWSKTAVGFATPVPITDNRPGRELVPAATSPDILRLWTNGADSPEYFLVENRAPVGFDRALPFASSTVGGLLIWHVDEEVATNDDAGHPRVALEQADGRRDIEANRNFGDAGDPYSLGAAFTATSQPASQSYAGAETQVRVENLRLVRAAVFAADFTVETAPALTRSRLVIRDDTGNGDGGLDATERGRIEVAITNHGLDARAVMVDLASADPRIAIAGGPIAAGDVGQNATVELGSTFEFLVADLPADPYPVTLTLGFTAAGYAASEEVVLVAGDVVGMSARFDGEADGFVHSAGRSGYRDDWHLAAGYGREGGTAFRCAPRDSSAYADLTDARLDSPLFALDGACRLFLWHTIDAEVDVGPRAWDGGLVEISLAGAPFVPVPPVGGYTHRIIRNAASPISDREVFSGTTAGFERVEFDLSGMMGAARLRFHFGSDASVTRSGWVVDDVVVVSPAEPYAVRFPAPAPEAGGVRVRFEVEEFFPENPYQGRGFHVYRRGESPSFPLREGGRDAPPGYEILTSAPLAPGESFLDREVREAEIFSYILEDLRRAGEEPRRYGPRQVYVAGGAVGPRIVRAVPTVFEPAHAPTTRIEFLVPPGPGPNQAAAVPVKLRVFDLAGRLVATLVEGRLLPGKNVAEWNGIGGRGIGAPSGVYFLRLEAAGQHSGGRVVLVR